MASYNKKVKVECAILYFRALRQNTLQHNIPEARRRGGAHLPFQGPGASTPCKRWSKCTMEKVGEAFFVET